jgi:hypothetical protein
MQYLSLDGMRIGKLYHLAVDVVFSQSLPGILSTFENIFKKFIKSI